MGGMTGLVELEKAFRDLCAQEGRRGVIATTSLSEVRLLPEQEGYLQAKVVGLKLPREEITAVSLGLAYRRDEIDAIPQGWPTDRPPDSRWDDYVHAYHAVNLALNRIVWVMAQDFQGVPERATMDGLAGKVEHVTQYFPYCISHRSVAEAARLGWRGKHGLIVTPEFGSAFRLASLFLPGRVESPRRELRDCGECEACLDACPLLKRGASLPDLNSYREACRRRIKALALEADVCGICVRRCWEVVAEPGWDSL